jgi:hypothetical protein
VQPGVDEVPGGDPLAVVSDRVFRSHAFTMAAVAAAMGR